MQRTRIASRRTSQLALFTLIAFAVALALVPSRPASAASTPTFRLAPLAHSFEGPVWVGGAGDGTSRLYVAEQGGRVWSVLGSRKRLLLDLRRSVAHGGEQGLLSLAVTRNRDGSGRLYAYLVRPDGDGQLRRYTLRGDSIVSGSARVIITVPLSPPAATNHNGGQVWAMGDGTLVLSTGDGGGAGDPNGNAQRLDRLTGKLLRVAPRASGGYAIPRSNPFVGRRGARGEVWALGLRNPWRFSVDAPTGDMWIGDVGQGEREEVNRLVAGRPAGANFGWRRLEGDRVYDAGTALTAGTRYVAPRIAYSHAGGRCSVTGGVVYRGPVTALRGWYLYADFCTNTISADRTTGTRARVTRRAVGGIVHFGAGARGDVFVASATNGRIYRIVAG